MKDQETGSPPESSPGCAWMRDTSVNGLEALALLLEPSGDGLISVDAHWRITYLNSAARRILQRSPAETDTAVLWDVFPEAMGRPLFDRYQRAMQERIPTEFEEYLTSLDRWFEHRCLPVPAGGLIVLLRDVGPRKRVEEALRRSETRFRRLFDHIPEGLITLDRDAHVLAMNSTILGGLSQSRMEDIAGRDWLDLWDEPCRAPARHALKMATTGATAHFQAWCGTGAAKRWWDVTLSRLPRLVDRFCSDDAYLCVLRDRTAAKHVEEEQADAAARDHRIAEALQANLLPALTRISTPGLTVGAHCLPLHASEAKVGGDFYDAFPLPNGRSALVVGDVMGKGLAAALSVAEIRFALRGFLWQDPCTACALDRINQFLIDTQRLEERPRNVLVGLSLAVVDPTTGAVEIGLAGTEAALILRTGTAEVKTIATPGNAILGAIANAPYETIFVRLTPGDTLVLLTDGITEARTASGFFGINGAAAALAAASGCERRTDPSSLAHSITGAAALFAQNGLHDDVCVLAARRDDSDDAATRLGHTIRHFAEAA